MSCTATAPERQVEWGEESKSGYLTAIEDFFLPLTGQDVEADDEQNGRILAAMQAAKADSLYGNRDERVRADGRLAALRVGHEDWCLRCELGAESTAGPAYLDWYARTKEWATSQPRVGEDPPRPAPLSDEQIEAVRNAEAEHWERSKEERARQQAMDSQAEYQDALATAREANEEARFRRADKNPNATPDSLLYVPGFVDRVMRHTLKTAYSPDRAIAFAGALALQAALTARKLRSPSNLRTPVYLLATAWSGDGKNRPREVNAEILRQCPGMMAVVKGAMGSGAGIEEALAVFPVRLFQSDEFDTLLKQAAESKDGSGQAIIRLLLNINSEANNRAYPMRALASDREREERTIDTPSLILFGTCTPKNFHNSLTETMLEAGLFARMLVFHGDPMPVNQRVKWEAVPTDIMDEAKFWASYRPPGDGSGNLADIFPDPLEVPYVGRGEDVLIEAGEIAEHEKRKAKAAEDNVGCSVWSRFRERATQLAMLYGASVNCRHPTINEDGATWAVQLVRHQIKTMLEQAGKHCGISEHEKLCQKFMAKLNKPKTKEEKDKGEKDKELLHEVLARRMKIPANVFKSVKDTLVERGQVQVILPRTYRAVG